MHTHIHTYVYSHLDKCGVGGVDGVDGDGGVDGVDGGGNDDSQSCCQQVFMSLRSTTHLSHTCSPAPSTHRDQYLLPCK